MRTSLRTASSRGRFTRSWARNEPTVLLGLAVVSLLLGVWGFEEMRRAGRLSEEAGFIDSVYSALEVFRDPAGWFGVPWQLELSRFLVLLVVSIAVLRLLFQAAWAGRDAVILKTWRGHAVVCADAPVGLAVARAVARRSPRTVVITPDETLANSARAEGIRAIVDDPTAADVLARAGLQEASLFVIALEDDAVNAGLAVRTTRLISYPERRLRCIAHVRDMRIREWLRDAQLRLSDDRRSCLDIVNVYDTAARTMLDRAAAEGDLSSVAVAGSGPLADALVSQLAARLTKRTTSGRRAPVLIVRQDAARFVDSLLARLPFVARVIELVPVEDSIDHCPDLAGKSLPATRSICHFFVNASDDAASVVAGLALRASEATQESGVSVFTERDSGLAEVAGTPGLAFFSAEECASSPDMLVSGFLEQLARSIHEDWLARELAKERSTSTPATLVPWDELCLEIRVANVEQAASMLHRLRRLGCELVPESGPSAPPIEIDSNLLEELAREEHERWVRERVRAGWRFARERDDTEQTHPSLVAYDELSEEEKEKDRAAVSSIPSILARAGLVLRRAP